MILRGIIALFMAWLVCTGLQAQDSAPKKKIILKRQKKEDKKKKITSVEEALQKEKVKDWWLEKEKRRIRARYFSQFQNLFLLVGAGMALRSQSNSIVYRGFTEIPASNSDGIQPGFTFQFSMLAEIQNRFIRANTFGPRKWFLRLGSLSNLTFQNEKRSGKTQYGEVKLLRQSISISEVLYYYFDPTMLKTQKIPVLNKTTFFIGPVFMLDMTAHAETKELQSGLSFPAPRETDFYLGGTWGFHIIFRTNWMILFQHETAFNLTPNTSHPFSGEDSQMQYGINMRFMLSAGVRI